MNSKNSDLQISLLENGIDFLEKAISELNSNDDRKYKFVILNLFSGLTLIFKERVKSYKWELLFEDVEKSNITLLENGNFYGVSPDNLLLRLRGLLDSPLTDEEENLYRLIRNKRNKIEHFEINESLDSLKDIAARTLVLACKFIQENKSLFQIDQTIESRVNNISKEASKIEIFKTFQLPKVRTRTGHDVGLIECPICEETAYDFILTSKCKNCFFTMDDPTELASMYKEKILKINMYEVYSRGGEDAQFVCPSCFEDCLIKREEDYICFNCKKRFFQDEVYQCEECREVLLQKNEDLFCPACN